MDRRFLLAAVASLGLLVCPGTGLVAKEEGQAPDAATAPLPPLTEAEQADIRRWIRELDSDLFIVRERASLRLRQLDERVIPFLEAAQGHPSLEVQLRTKAILSLLQVDPLRAFCSQSDDKLNDEHGMFLIAQILNPKLKRDTLTKQLDQIADQVRAKLAAQPSSAGKRGNEIDPQVAIEAVRAVLFTEMRFTGNKDDYDNPDNSSLEKVLATKKGLPITLSRLVVLVARRVEIPIVGVPGSGRYIVKYDGARAPAGFAKDDIFLDAFDGGKILSRDDRRQLFPGNDPDRLAPPDSNRDMLQRMLTNLCSDLDHNPERAAQLNRANEMRVLLQRSGLE